jgi:hypothetical protein
MESTALGRPSFAALGEGIGDGVFNGHRAAVMPGDVLLGRSKLLSGPLDSRYDPSLEVGPRASARRLTER